MSIGSQPLVSIVTPVLNGERYLQECIQSVLNQDYNNWEYIILNNCSTDRTLEIAQKYQQKDKRIKVFSNDAVLAIMDNWNTSLSKMSPDSVYCKIVHADDWLFPSCLKEMVAAAEAHPTVSIVGSYILMGSRVVCNGFPYPSTFIKGEKICRWALKRKVYPFYRPSSLLIRSEYIRNRMPFYIGNKINADVSVLYDLLKTSDFSFVHQVLSFIRTHDESYSTAYSSPDNLYLLSNMDLLIKYGPSFFSGQEFKRLLNYNWNKYYDFLSDGFFQRRGQSFWVFHHNGLKNMEYKLKKTKLIYHCLSKFLASPVKVLKLIIMASSSDT